MGHGEKRLARGGQKRRAAPPTAQRHARQIAVRHVHVWVKRKGPRFAVCSRSKITYPCEAIRQA